MSGRERAEELDTFLCFDERAHEEPDYRIGKIEEALRAERRAALEEALAKKPDMMTAADGGAEMLIRTLIEWEQGIRALLAEEDAGPEAGGREG